MNLEENPYLLKNSICRKFVLKTAFKANLTMGQFQISKPALDTKGTVNTSLGHVSHLVADHIRAVRNEEKDKMCQKIHDIFDEFTVTADGSPIGNDTEAT